MKSILFTFELARFPQDAFIFLNELASAPDTTITLLNVLNLNIVAPDNRVYDEALAETEARLRLVAREWLPSAGTTHVRVRLGKPTDEILAEAKENRAELLIVPNYGPSLWSRLKFVCSPSADPMISPLAAKLAREARCPILSLPAGHCFNGEREWRPLPLLHPQAKAVAERSAGLRACSAWHPESRSDGSIVCPTRPARRRFRLRFS